MQGTRVWIIQISRGSVLSTRNSKCKGPGVRADLECSRNSKRLVWPPWREYMHGHIRERERVLGDEGRVVEGQFRSGLAGLVRTWTFPLNEMQSLADFEQRSHVT